MNLDGFSDEEKLAITELDAALRPFEGTGFEGPTERAPGSTRAQNWLARPEDVGTDPDIQLPIEVEALLSMQGEHPFRRSDFAALDTAWVRFQRVFPSGIGERA